MNTSNNDQYRMETLREQRPEAMGIQRRMEISEAVALLRPHAKLDVADTASITELAKHYERQLSIKSQAIDRPAYQTPEVHAEVTLLSERRDQDALSQLEQAVSLAYEQGQGNPLYDQEAA